jgi:hypothetical protein
MVGPRRLVLKVGIGLVGVVALAAVVVPKTAWEALMMEVSSNHNANWQRDATTGQLVATSDKPPDQSYKPLLSDQPPAPKIPSETSSLTVGYGDIVGTWRIRAADGDVAGNLILIIDPFLTVATKCESPKCRLDGMSRELVDVPDDQTPADHYCEDSGPNIRLTSSGPGVYTHQSKQCVYYRFAAPTRESPHYIYTTKWQFVVEGNSISGTVRDSVKFECLGVVLGADERVPKDCDGWGGWPERDIVFRGLRVP